MQNYELVITEIKQQIVRVKAGSYSEAKAQAESWTNPLEKKPIVTTYNAERAPRYCEHCGAGMFEGYCLWGGGDYYCSEDCLKANFTAKEIEAMDIGEDDSDSYWTTWEDFEEDYHDAPETCVQLDNIKEQKNEWLYSDF
jgi:hypothetical protein